MTREEIEKLEGWELAAAVAEHVMGWPRYRCGEHEIGSRPYPHFWIKQNRMKMYVLVDDGMDNHPAVYWRPPTDIAQALQVADTLSQVTLTQKIGAWECQCFNGIGGVVFRAETVQLAICRCALLAAMEAMGEITPAVFATPAPAAERGAR